MSFQENHGTLLDKITFLNNFDNLSRHIKEGMSCYAISAEWWQNFEMILTIARSDDDMMIPNFGPINNTSIVNLSETYQDLIKPTTSGYNINLDRLIDLKDWEQMSIKTNLRYNEDFVILSQSVWRFIKTKFSGGPEIELIPEKKGIIKKDICRVTNYEEPYLQDDLMVSFDLMRIYWTRDENYDFIKAMYVSKTIKARHLLLCLAKHTNINPDKSMLTGKSDDTNMEYGSTILTLEDYKVSEDQVLNITQRSPNDPNPLGKGTNTDNMFEMNDLNGNIAKGSEVGEYPPKNNNNNNNEYIMKKDFPEIEEFKAKLVSKAQDQQAISMEYKQLPEIKQNMNKLLQDWTVVNSNEMKIE